MLSCVGSCDLVLRLEWFAVMVKIVVGDSSGDIFPTRDYWRSRNDVLEHVVMAHSGILGREGGLWI